MFRILTDLEREQACQSQKHGPVVQAQSSWFLQVFGLIWVGVVLILWQLNILGYRQQPRAGKDKFCLFSLQCKQQKWRSGIVVLVQIPAKCLDVCASVGQKLARRPVEQPDENGSEG